MSRLAYAVFGWLFGPAVLAARPSQQGDKYRSVMLLKTALPLRGWLAQQQRRTGLSADASSTSR